MYDIVIVDLMFTRYLKYDTKFDTVCIKRFMIDSTEFFLFD